MLIGAASGLGDYPGRGLLAGALANGDPFLLYFVTGRSPASRDRHAVFGSDGEVLVEPTAGPPDDELRHYVAVTRTPSFWLVGNGTHVADLSAAGTVDELPRRFRSWDFEPDPPVCTPRIVAAVVPAAPPRALIAAARRHPGRGTEHTWLDVAAVPAGTAVRIQTYAGDAGQPVPYAVPTWVDSDHDIEELAGEVWHALDPGRRVLLVARNLASSDTLTLDHTS